MKVLIFLFLTCCTVNRIQKILKLLKNFGLNTGIVTFFSECYIQKPRE